VKPVNSQLEHRSPFSSPELAVKARAADKAAPYTVPSWLHFLGGLVHRHRSFWLWLGDLETWALGHDLDAAAVRQPIYVCGLARSGSTLLHEVVCTHPGVATLRIKDYPMVFTPYWWRQAQAGQRPQAPRERPHQDGMMISTESPDAIEEMLWMAFFPQCHNPAMDNRVGSAERHWLFEKFYRTYLRKLLLAEQASRYAAKNNYHTMRLPYLVRLFPDAKFIIPVRAPATHIASLMRQQRQFSAGQRRHPYALAFMQRSGHFEFGLDRRPMHLGDNKRVQEIRAAWAEGEEVRGLALYWDMVYRYLAQLLETDAQVRAAAHVIRFETLCEAPRKTLEGMLRHCALPETAHLVEQFAPGIRIPSYYYSNFSAQDEELIAATTGATARLWGY
jgi:hypothetical protein